jgi:hypothetical protein
MKPASKGGCWNWTPNGRPSGAVGTWEGRRRESRRGEAKAAPDEAAADKVLQQALGVPGLSESQLAQNPKSAPEKAVLAWWLRQRTTVPLRWVSEHLAMGHFTRVSQTIDQVQRRPGRKQAQIKRLLNGPADQETTVRNQRNEKD